MSRKDAAVVADSTRPLRDADTPEALYAIIEDGFRRRDPDSIVAAYDDDATLVVPSSGALLRGRAAIRDATAAALALEPELTLEISRKVEDANVSLVQGRWRLKVTLPDGTRNEMSGRTTLVARRRLDDSWGIVLDDPLSPTE